MGVGQEGRADRRPAVDREPSPLTGELAAHGDRARPGRRAVRPSRRASRPARRRARPPAASRAAGRPAAASQRRTAISLCGWMCSTWTIRAGSGSIERGERVDRDVRARPGVEDAPGRRVGDEGVAHEPGAVAGVEQVPGLGPVAVDPELLAEQRAAGEDRDDPALADRALERPVRVERPDDRRRQAVGVAVADRVSASPAIFEAAYGEAGLRRVRPRRSPRAPWPGRRPCTCS